MPTCRADAQRYIGRLEELTGVPAAIVSTGSAREDTIIRDDSIAARWLKPVQRAASVGGRRTSLTHCLLRSQNPRWPPDRCR